MKHLFILILISGVMACAQTPYVDLPVKASTSGADGHTVMSGGSPYKMTHSVLFSNTADSLVVHRDSLNSYDERIENISPGYFGRSGTEVSLLNAGDDLLLNVNESILFYDGTALTTNPTYGITLWGGGAGGISVGNSDVQFLSSAIPYQTATFDFGSQAYRWRYMWADRYTLGNNADYGMSLNGTSIQFKDFTGTYELADLAGDVDSSWVEITVDSIDTGSELTFRVNSTKELALTATALYPTTTGGLDLGTTLKYYDDLFANTHYVGAAGYYIDESGGDMRLTDPSGTYTLTQLAAGGNWDKSGTNLSPTTSGDDILLATTESIGFIDNGSYIYGRGIDTIEVVLNDATSWMWDINNNTTYNHLLPSSNKSLQLGSSTRYWTQLFTDRVYVDNGAAIIDVDGLGNMTFTDGVTSVKTLAELAAGGGGATASNGLTLVGSDIQLKGTKTASDTIDLDGNSFTIIGGLSGTSQFRIQDDDEYIHLKSGTYNHITVETAGINGVRINGTTGLNLTQGSSSVSRGIVLNASGMVVTDVTVGGGGLKNAADYSGDFTDRHLVDKEYVDDAVAAASGTTDHTALSNIGVYTHAQVDTKLDSLRTVLADTVQGVEVYKAKADTTTLWAWHIADSSQFQSGVFVAKWYHYGPDTLYVHEGRVGSDFATADFTYNVQYMPEQDDAPVVLYTAARQVEGAEVDAGGETDTPDNPSIPPGSWIMLTIDAQTVKPPDGATFNFIGYEY